jgi:hypothetical protein
MSKAQSKLKRFALYIPCGYSVINQDCLGYHPPLIEKLTKKVPPENCGRNFLFLLQALPLRIPTLVILFPFPCRNLEVKSLHKKQENLTTEITEITEIFSNVFSVDSACTAPQAHVCALPALGAGTSVVKSFLVSACPS